MEITMISIQEPEKKHLANLLKGIAILMKYDCTADIRIVTEGDFYVIPMYVISVNVDSEDFESRDLEELKELGWTKEKDYSWDNWYYQG